MRDRVPRPLPLAVRIHEDRVVPRPSLLGDREPQLLTRLSVHRDAEIHIVAVESADRATDARLRRRAGIRTRRRNDPVVRPRPNVDVRLREERMAPRDRDNRVRGDRSHVVVANVLLERDVQTARRCRIETRQRQLRACVAQVNEHRTVENRHRLDLVACVGFDRDRTRQPRRHVNVLDLRATVHAREIYHPGLIRRCVEHPRLKKSETLRRRRGSVLVDVAVGRRRAKRRNFKGRSDVHERRRGRQRRNHGRERERTSRHIRRDTDLVETRRIAFECAKHLDRVDLRIMRHLESVDADQRRRIARTTRERELHKRGDVRLVP